MAPVRPPTATSDQAAVGNVAGGWSRGRVPASTYRLQFHASFRFADAEALVPYLEALGVTHCYCSSYLQAVPGSLHGYDVADPTSLNPEIGSEDDYRRFVEALRAHGMSQVLDV